MMYFQQSQPMLSIYLSMLSSPMIILVISMISLMSCLQYMDPNAIQELQESGPKKSPNSYLPSLIKKINENESDSE